MRIPDFQTSSGLVYSLPERYPIIQRSTWVLATRGLTLAKLEGQIFFTGNVILDVWELLDFETRRIRNYSYEIYRVAKKLRGPTHLNIPISLS